MQEQPLHRAQALRVQFDTDAAVRQFGINIIRGTTDPADWRNGLHAQEVHCLSAAIERGNKLMTANLINNFLLENIALREKLKEYEHRPPATTAQG